MRIRAICETETEIVSSLIRDTLTRINERDYSEDIIQNLCELYSPANIAQQARNSDLLVAIENDEIVGTGTLEGDFIKAVFVKTDHLGRGVGKKLMEALEGLAGERGLREVALSASITAHSFYQQLGYVTLEERSSKSTGRVFAMNKVLKHNTRGTKWNHSPP